MMWHMKMVSQASGRVFNRFLDGMFDESSLWFLWSITGNIEIY